MTEREHLVERWLELTRSVLPGMAAARRWPIALDHCFMRLFLDHAMGGPWHQAVRRPAVRHMNNAALRRAVGLAESVAAEPDLLPGLNAASLAWRRARKAAP